MPLPDITPRAENPTGKMVVSVWAKNCPLSQLSAFTVVTSCWDQVVVILDLSWPWINTFSCYIKTLFHPTITVTTTAVSMISDNWEMFALKRFMLCFSHSEAVIHYNKVEHCCAIRLSMPWLLFKTVFIEKYEVTVISMLHKTTFQAASHWTNRASGNPTSASQT